MVMLMNSCSDLEHSIHKLRKSNIVEIKLNWLIEKNNHDPKYTELLLTTNKDFIAKFFKSLSDVQIEHGNSSVTWRSLGIGKLYLKENNGKETVIDVTFDGYFFAEKRSLDMLFFSPALTQLLKEIVQRSNKESLLLQEGLWEKLSKGVEKR